VDRSDPIVVRAEPLLLAGISGPLPPRSAPPPARQQAIQALWRALLERVDTIQARVGAERYSVIENDVHDTGTPPLMRVLVAVRTHAGLPAWCEPFTLPPGRYAAFEHRGPAREMSKTVAALYRDWAPRIPGLFSIDWEVTRLPEGYDPTDPAGRFDYWLPLP
jgi:AraC family transcriptional regulator